MTVAWPVIHSMAPIGVKQGCLKCGNNGCLEEGQWFVFVREKEIIEPPIDLTNFWDFK